MVHVSFADFSSRSPEKYFAKITTPRLNAINNQLAERGLYIKSGEVSIIDANVIEANKGRSRKGIKLFLFHDVVSYT